MDSSPKDKEPNRKHLHRPRGCLNLSVLELNLRVYTDFVVFVLCHCGGKVRFFILDTISMGSSDGDDRTFNGDFSEEGVVKLKERVKVKLKEYMGDYTDDILVV